MSPPEEPLAPSGLPRPPFPPEPCTPGSYTTIPTAPGSPASWLRPSILWRSRNDIVARIHDPVDAIREGWLQVQGVPRGAARADALRIRGFEGLDRASFLVLGDTGEGDASQMAVVPGLRACARDAAFTVICSDVIYPAGEARDYAAKFYGPYAELPGPIYALPGNHDWYDRLVGFMVHVCGARTAPPPGLGGERGWRGLLVHRLWRTPSAIPSPTATGPVPGSRSPGQLGPYWSLDVGPVRLVAIDTGIAGTIDGPQADWLARVSAERPEAAKILLTGKPLVVDGELHPCAITGRAGSVDEIVRRPEHGYVAAVGGDIHNYQRYPVTLRDGRVLQYVVSGGGGAFMHATHKIPSVDDPERGLAAKLRPVIGEVSERETHLFPARAWSLFWFARLVGAHRLGLTYPEAGAVVGEELDLDPLDDRARELLRRYRREGPPLKVRAFRRLLFRSLPAPGRLFQRFLSEIFDSNRRPMAKSFLRFDVTGERIVIRCVRATGCEEDEHAPPVEDEVVIELPGTR